MSALRRSVSLFLALAAACGSAGTAPGQISISLDPASASLMEGETQQFNAHVTGAIDTSVAFVVDEGPPGGRITPGGLYTAPQAVGMFHVRATSNGDPTRAQVALVTVSGPAASPVIASFTAAPATIQPGGSSLLSWTVTGAQSIALNQGIGAVTGASVSVSPAATTTYTLSATGNGQTVTAQATVIVTAPAGGPIIASFTATPGSVVAGAAVALAWSVSQATSLSIDQGVGTVTGAGVSTTPPASTTYRLTATNSKGSATAAVTVTVAPAVPKPLIDSFTAAPGSIQAGGSSMLSWSVQNATSLMLDGSAVSGTSKLVSPAATTTYTLTAQGSGGTASASVTVTLGAATTDPGTPGCSFSFKVDSSRSVHPISRYIYGYNSDAPAGTTLMRLGGNRWTAYNWETNASNAGSDYKFENDTFLTRSTTPGEAAYPTIAADQAAGRATLITIPMQGYVAADENSQYDNTKPIADHFFASLPRKGAAFASPPDLTDRFVYQDEYIDGLFKQFPAAATSATSPIHFELDNEPDLWASTHAEIERSPLTYDELLSKTLATAAAIKDVAPGALIYGPVSYGFTGYYNLQGALKGQTPDGEDWFLDLYLRDLRRASAAQGRRLLDVLDLHWYSEARGNGVRVNDADNSLAVQLVRVQAPRSLWDLAYKEPSYISNDVLGGPIRLIPRLRQKIADGFPGTKLAFTEYNHGGADDITGAVAEADTLGIFGREDVYASSFWELNVPNQHFAHGAHLSFRDYDGAGGAFGDTSIYASSADDSKASIYASVDAGHPERVVLVAINKGTVALCTGIQLKHSQALTKAHLFQLTANSPVASNAAVPQALSDLPVTSNSLDVTLPPWSVTTLVLVP